MEDVIVAGRTSAAGAANAAESPKSAVSWAAILAGALVAGATSLLLLVLATGLGLATISPWENNGASAQKLTAMTGIALIVIQWISACIGGYLTGRLRVKWVGTHTHEVFFRDTAHGLITWAVATLLMTSVLTAGMASLMGMGLRAAAAVGSEAAIASPNAANAGAVTPYDLEMLLRPAPGADARSGEIGEARSQTAHILTRALASGELPQADRTYLAQLVATQSGVSESDAQRRIDDAWAQLKAAQASARQLADAARKDAELASILAALALLTGAFIASVSAALGGRRRDLHP